MKKQIGIWMDSKEAFIITLDGQKSHLSRVSNKTESDQKEAKEVKKTPVTDASPLNTGKNIEIVEKKMDAPLVAPTAAVNVSGYQKEIFELIKDADEWYLCGPTQDKNEFKQFIQETHAGELHKVKAVEDVKEISNHELITKVKTFYNAK